MLLRKAWHGEQGSRSRRGTSTLDVPVLDLDSYASRSSRGTSFIWSRVESKFDVPLLDLDLLSLPSLSGERQSPIRPKEAAASDAAGPEDGVHAAQDPSDGGEPSRPPPLQHDAARLALDTGARRLGESERLLNTLGYEATLARGYAVVRAGDAVVTGAEAATSAPSLEIEFRDGRVEVSPKGKGSGQGSLF